MISGHGAMLCLTLPLYHYPLENFHTESFTNYYNNNPITDAFLSPRPIVIIYSLIEVKIIHIAGGKAHNYPSNFV